MRDKGQIVHEIQFNPMSYMSDSASLALRNVLIAQNIDIPMKLRVFLRRNHWAFEVPVGVFHNDYRLVPVTADAADHHRGERDMLLLEAHKALKAQYGKIRRPWTPRSDILELAGVFCYTLPLLQVFAEHSKARSFFTAAAAFVKAANNDFSLVRSSRRQVTPFTPPEERVAKFGTMVRGPLWTEDEDNVIRRWFGPRTIGTNLHKHAKLTDEEWGYVLEALQHRRTRKSVLDRITTLNKRLHDAMAVDGYVSRSRLAEYMSRVLGERPRRPRMISTKRRVRRRHDVPAPLNIAMT